jgi:hypothetical protein
MATVRIGRATRQSIKTSKNVYRLRQALSECVRDLYIQRSKKVQPGQKSKDLPSYYLSKRGWKSFTKSMDILKNQILRRHLFHIDEFMYYGTLAGSQKWQFLRSGISRNMKLREELLDAAEFSELTYHKSKEQLQEYLGQLNCTGHRVYTNKMLAVLGKCNNVGNGHRLAVSLRGTFERENWFTNFDVKLIDYPVCPKCKVHSGWFRNYRSFLWDPIRMYIEDQLVAACRSNSSLPKDILLTGHSMGGAMATYATVDVSLALDRLKRLFPTCLAQPIPIKLITFAQPRVGNGRFVDFFEKEATFKKITYVRVVNLDDAVVSAPPQRMGYRHLSHMLPLRSWGRTMNRRSEHWMMYYRGEVTDLLYKRDQLERLSVSSETSSRSSESLMVK